MQVESSSGLVIFPTRSVSKESLIFYVMDDILWPWRQFKEIVQSALFLLYVRDYKTTCTLDLSSALLPPTASYYPFQLLEKDFLKLLLSHKCFLIYCSVEQEVRLRTLVEVGGRGWLSIFKLASASKG